MPETRPQTSSLIRSAVAWSNRSVRAMNQKASTTR